MLANSPSLCILLGYYNLKKYAKAPPLCPRVVVKGRTNPHLVLGGVEWGISLIRALTMPIDRLESL